MAEGGYSSASVQGVAARAGVAVGTVYRHFPSKAELFAEVFRIASQRELDVMADVARPDDRTAAERAGAAAETFSRRALAGPVMAYALIAEPVDPAVESERLRLRRGYRDVFAGLLEEGVEAGDLRPQTLPPWPPRWWAPSARRSSDPSPPAAGSAGTRH